ncbi:MAG: thiamine phosphate synthase [Proteobacteria bacterium]|nr:thiamine phosphate synthase [Pseudomonadota bacterium]MBU1581774.1 thiamine phosphate synthase [Pseudomonadota bacterium]MBU2453277.1 thiamine phosphate synthase [Pseudomonadota bacterium]MBU2630593.1 thiamine phosphate synthase [Pseudomonadota bacterium]
MKIGIAGIGGIGSNVARHLAQAGVRQIRIVDHDRVEALNLNRQFYGFSQVGEKKTDSLEKNLKQIFPDMDIEKIDQKIEPGDAGVLFSDCSIVVEGFDNKTLKKMIIEDLSGTNKVVVSASGIAGKNMAAVTTRKMGNCRIVGDFVSDQTDHELFPPKVAMVAAVMAGMVLRHMGKEAPEFKPLSPRRLPHGIYGILGEKFSLGRTNADVARQMVAAGIDVLQYREKLKDKSLKQMLEECLEIREITRDAGVPFIINDHVDIALMVGADGIHQGQDDLPVSHLRRIAPDMMIGCSTHSPDQARKALADGADYIGVGPIFPTQTKEDVCDAVGLEYLEQVVKTHDIPFVAIGGIKRHNLRDVLSRGAKTVCLVTEIIGARDIEKRIREIKQILGEFK